SCDGCTIAVAGATNPKVEHLLQGIVPGLPRVDLIHTVVSTEVGPDWVHNLFMADRGELDAPFVIVFEGSVFDETRSGSGYFMETASAVLLFLQGLAPLPEFDELGRPAWIYGETVHRHCPRAGYYEEGVFAQEYGDKECLVELGCWGPVVQCNISERGMINGIGGCMQMGGICIGCSMPGFPDRFSPMYSAPPGSLIS